MRTVEYILPSCWAPAIINDDYSGLSDEDEKRIYAWFNRICERQGFSQLYCTGTIGEKYFSHGHDENRREGADVIICTFIAKT